jgi:hypothetical protein
MHHARHKNILKTMRKLAEIDKEVAKYLIEKIKLHVPNVKTFQEPALVPALTPGQNLDLNKASSIMSWAERNQAKKIGTADTPNKRREVEAFSQQDTDFISNAIHLIIHEGKGAWKGRSIFGAFCRKDEPKIDTEVGANCISKAIASPDLKSVTLNSKQRKNEKKITAIVRARHIRGNSKRYSTKKATKDNDYDGLDPQILLRLGIKVIDPPKHSPIRRELIRKLIAQIKEDLSIQAQEQAEAKIRGDGFWLWAGRGAYHTIMKNREDIDWATGVRRSSSNENANNQDLRCQLPEDTKEGEKDVSDSYSQSNDATLNDTLVDSTGLEVVLAAKTQANSAVHERETDLQTKSTTKFNKSNITMTKA